MTVVAHPTTASNHQRARLRTPLGLGRNRVQLSLCRSAWTAVATVVPCQPATRRIWVQLTLWTT